jgi:hypothetical protein
MITGAPNIEAFMGGFSTMLAVAFIFLGFAIAIGVIRRLASP